MNYKNKKGCASFFFELFLWITSGSGSIRADLVSYFSMKKCRFVVIFFMAKISTSEKSRRVAEMRDRLTEYATGNNPPAQRIRAADIALRLLHPERYQLDSKQHNALVGRAKRFLQQYSPHGPF